MPKFLPRLGLILAACAIVGGLASVLQRHAQQADSFPTYSSFRTLPEGASILYEALSHTPGIRAERNVRPLSAAKYSDAAILMLGIPLASVSRNAQWFVEMEELAAKGNRVIIAILPHRTRFLQSDPKELEKAFERWKVIPAFVRETDIRDDEDAKLLAGWPMYFSKAPGWDVTRKESDRAVVIERGQGKGRIILLANPYLLSNAAMVDDRQTAFLTTLLGPAHLAVFDETHFGIEQTGSIAGLANRYRLQGLVLGLILTAALFIWKSAAGFPPPAVPAPTQSVRGEDAHAAFLNLLRSNIKTEDIVATCVNEWNKQSRNKITALGGNTPVAAYAEIQQACQPQHKHKT